MVEPINQRHTILCYVTNKELMVDLDPFNKELQAYVSERYPGTVCPRINFDCVGPGPKDVKFLSIKSEGGRALYDEDSHAQLTLDYSISLDRNYPIEAGLVVINLLDIKNKVNG